MKYLCVVILLMLCTGCSSPSVNQQGKLPDNTPSLTQDTGALDVQVPLANTGTGSNEYTFFFKESNIEKVTLHHTAGQETKLYFINDGAKKMHVQLTLPANGNLRLSQIIAPDGTADGPFGIETDYDLTQNGGYQLLFHENMMAGDPWNGDVQIQVTLSK